MSFYLPCCCSLQCFANARFCNLPCYLTFCHVVVINHIVCAHPVALYHVFKRLRTTLRADYAHIKSESILAVALRSVFLFTMLLQFTMLCKKSTLLQFTMLFEHLDAHKSDTSSCSSQCLSIYHIATFYHVV